MPMRWKVSNWKCRRYGQRSLCPKAISIRNIIAPYTGICFKTYMCGQGVTAPFARRRTAIHFAIPNMLRRKWSDCLGV